MTDAITTALTETQANEVLARFIWGRVWRLHSEALDAREVLDREIDLALICGEDHAAMGRVAGAFMRAALAYHGAKEAADAMFRDGVIGAYLPDEDGAVFEVMPRRQVAQ